MLVDDGIWVSGLVADDVHHAASRGWLGERLAHGDTLVVPSTALAEVAGAVSRRTGVPELGHRAAQGLVRAPGLRLIAVDRDLGLQAARIAADLRLRGADALYVALAHAFQLPLVTWDEELRARAAAFVETTQP